MSSLKNPQNEAETPAPMPKSQQGKGGTSPDSDPAGQQGGKKARMAPQPSAPPGLEQDAHGNPIPFEQRTEEDQELARGGVKPAQDRAKR